MLSEAIESVIKSVKGLQVKANAQGISVDFESILINLEQKKNQAEYCESMESVNNECPISS
jgi:hypothetical protein